MIDKGGRIMPYSHNEGPEDNDQRIFNNPFLNFFMPQWNLPGQNHGFPGQGPYPPTQQFPNQGGPFPGGPGQFPGQNQGGAAGQPPLTPPPPFTPEEPQIQTKAVDPGAIHRCLFRFTYIWTARDAFWFYPTFIGRTSIAGYRWSRFRWVYFGIDLNRIQSFQCF